MKFDGYLFVSDMDATLLKNNHKVSEKNREAVEYFTSNGGLFTVATGRIAAAAAPYLEQININAPAILHNGAQIYDLSLKKTLFERTIEEERKDAIRRVYEKIPELGLEVYTSGGNVYVYRECSETKRFKARNIDVIYGMTDEAWKEKWLKVLLIGEKKLLNRYEPIYRRDYDSGYSVRSGAKYLDVVSSEASKGRALSTLAGIVGAKRVIAVGDNMNDISMLEAADVSFAVDNAEKEVKAAADFAAPDNNSDAIAYIIEKISEIGD